MMDKFIDINLQFFGEKTEEPTSKKIKDTRDKGQVAQSKELTGAVSLILGVYLVKIFGKDMLKIIINSLNYYFNMMYKTDINIVTAYNIFIKSVIFVVTSVLYIIAPVFVIVFMIQRLQVGTLFTFETLKPKPERLNPIEGFKKMFSKDALVNLFKSLLKITVVGYVGYVYIRDNLPIILKTIQLPKGKFLYLMAFLSTNLALRMAFVIFLIGVFDFFYQRYSYFKNIRMTKQEVKEEYKQTEGDPQIKSQIKQRQREMATKRMMQDLPGADVIITNPTHFAVALKYDEDKYDAPYVVAKGKDLLAQKIKQRAREYKIEIVENKILARKLYFDVEIGKVIPYELYEVVAEILAYVYNLRKERA